MLRYRGGSLSPLLTRPLRMLGGIVSFTVLDTLPDPWSLAGVIFLLVAVITFFATRAGRGLPGLLTGQTLVDARGDAVNPAAGMSDHPA